METPPTEPLIGRRRWALYLCLLAIAGSHLYFSIWLFTLRNEVRDRRKQLNVAPTTNHRQFLVSRIDASGTGQWRFYVNRPPGQKLRLNYGYSIQGEAQLPPAKGSGKIEAWIMRDRGQKEHLQEFFFDAYLIRSEDNTQIVFSTYPHIEIEAAPFIHCGTFRTHEVSTTDQLPAVLLRFADTESDRELVVWISEETEVMARP